MIIEAIVQLHGRVQAVALLVEKCISFYVVTGKFITYVITACTLPVPSAR
jgi:hypothetical protein